MKWRSLGVAFLMTAVMLFTVHARALADTDSECNAAFEGDDYGGASVACLYAYEDHYNAASSENGETRDLDLLLAGESLDEAGYSNIVSGLDVEKGQEQRAQAERIVGALRKSKFASVAKDAASYYAQMLSLHPTPPDDDGD